MPKIPAILQILVTAVLLFTGVWLFAGLSLPALLSYHEQYQLFLFTADYFLDSVRVPGGVADYVSEFFTQFYYHPWLGAAMLALVLTLIQLCTAAALHKGAKALPPLAAGLLSALPSLLILRHMNDENLLLSFPVAIAITQAALALTLLAKPSRWWISCILIFAVFVALYGCAGAAALLYPVEATLLAPGLRRRLPALLCVTAAACAWVAIVGALWYPEYPEWRMYMGINYYRIPNFPTDAFVPVCLSVLAIALAARIYDRLAANRANGDAGIWAAVAAGTAAVIAAAAVPGAYDADKMAVFRYDMLVRNQQWQAVLDQAAKKTPTDNISLQAVNLALAKTGQLGDRMFNFPQQGIESLIAPYSRDNTSCLVTSETFWHLGMVNSAFRYAFDIQEAIMNDRKSGRFMKRMAECMIVNGQYTVAEKYIDRLKHSLYYSAWAREAQTYLHNEEKISAHPTWGTMRRNRFKKEMLYYYPEIDKMLGILAVDSEGRNRMAWDFFCAALMLKGDVATLAGMYHYAGSDFSVTRIPEQVQEAIGMYWTAGHPSFEGLPYPISEPVQKRIADLARNVMQNQGNPAAWRTSSPGSYCLYFLERQMQQAKPQQYEQSTMREG